MRSIREVRAILASRISTTRKALAVFEGYKPKTNLKKGEVDETAVYLSKGAAEFRIRLEELESLSAEIEGTSLTTGDDDEIDA